MKQSKIFHTLYLAVMALPLFLMGVFAIYSQNHEINDNTLQVQENLKVNFNQKLNDGHFEENIDGWSTGQIYSINDNELLLTANGTSAYPQISHTFNFDTTHYYILSCDIRANDTFIAYSIGNGTIGYSTTFQIPQGTSKTIQRKVMGNGTTLIIYAYSNNIQSGMSYYISNIQVFDLTQMFGIGNEPTIEEFNALFPNSYYEYTESQEMYIENVYTTSYDDTDIMSQFMYVSYNALDKYLNFSKYQPFSAIYSWSQNTFFNGNAPIVFFIMFQMMCYWLVMSLFWLIFDVLLYVPSMIHKMIDKARLE